MKNHQTVTEINHEYDWDNEDAMDKQGVEEFMPVDATAWPLVQEWKFTHWGGSGDKWREDGRVAIYSNDTEKVYLEASIKGVPFFSVLSTLDQWGTWHTFRAGGPSVRMDEPHDQTFIYAQEWGNRSFLEALGHALIKLATCTEPDPAKYRDKSGQSAWRR